MIVALETSSTDLSIAIADRDGGLVDWEGWSAGYRHAGELLPRLLALVARAGRSLGDTTLVAVGDGPGSFTGLRVGMSVAKAIGFSVGCPVIGRPSLEAWLAAEPGAVAAIGRAGAREVYVATREEPEPHLIAHDEIPDSLRSARTVAPAELSAVIGLRDAVAPHRAATALAMVAAREGMHAASVARSGEAIDPIGTLERLEPRYLRAPRGVDASRIGQP